MNVTHSLTDFTMKKPAGITPLFAEP